MIRWIDKINQNHPMVQGIQIIYKIDGTGCSCMMCLETKTSIDVL